MYVLEGAHVDLKRGVREVTGAWGDGEVDWLRFDDGATDVFEAEEFVLTRDVAALPAHLENKVRTLAVGKTQHNIVSHVLSISTPPCCLSAYLRISGS